MIEQSNGTIEVSLKEWNLKAYDLFLRTKSLPEFHLSYEHETDTYKIKTPSRFAHLLGLEDNAVDHGWLPMSPFLREYQKWIIMDLVLPAKRFAVWTDTSTGKTPMLLEFARQVNYRTGGKVLIISPLNILQQTLDQAKDFYGDALPIRILETKEALKAWCQDGKGDIGITNPEKFIPRKGESEAIHEISYCTGVALDEASMLKASGGKIKWAIIKSCRGVEYKIALTATPAPNDTMEYASQGSFLEKLRSEGEIIWKYFARDKEGNWKVKENAKDSFYRFMAGWSVYMRDPKKYGFEDIFKDLPDPDVREYEVELTDEQRDYLLTHYTAKSRETSRLPLADDIEKLPMVKRIKYSEVAKGFIYEAGKAQRIASLKPVMVANKIKEDVADGLKCLVWTVFDEESKIIMEHLHGVPFSVEVITGKTKEKDRIAAIERFRKGDLDVLISLAEILGYGLNFPMCGSMVFSGFDDSFERYYQAFRRAYRWGQKKVLRVHIPIIPQLEGTVWTNVQTKQAKFINDVAIMEQNYITAMAANGRRSKIAM